MAEGEAPQAAAAGESDKGMPRLLSGAGAVATEPARSGAGAVDSFRNLYRMSATAGVGTTDYAAINALAIVALLLGLASIAALASNILLLIPLVGVVCAVIAFAQIVRSNGTQTGRAFAAIGLLFSLAIGSTIVGWRVMVYRAALADQKQLAGVIHDIGSEIAQDKLPELYAQTTDRFRDRVSLDLFERRLHIYNQSAQRGNLGTLTGFYWNQEPMLFQGGGDGAERTATAMAFMSFSRSSEPQREILTFVHQGDRWVLDDMPAQFPPEKKSPTPRRSVAGPTP